MRMLVGFFFTAVSVSTAVMAGWLVSSSQNHCAGQYCSTLGN